MSPEKLCIWLLSCFTGFLVSCSFGDEPELCPYNTRLEYWYAGSSTENVLPVYVDNLRQYLFNEQGELERVVTLRKDSVSEWTNELPPGKYTVVAWGNMENGAKDSIRVLPDGETRFAELTLSAGKQGVPPGYRGNTSRLYYGTGSFTVEPGQVSRQRVYLSHAHAVLSVTVRWSTGQPADGSFEMHLKGVPSLYGFVKGWETSIPSGDGVYSVPWIGTSITNHSVKGSMNYDGEVTGEFVTYRYTGSTHPYWSLWRNGVQIIRDLDLYIFFQTLPMRMDENIEQEFDIVVTVHEDKIVVAQGSMTDWDEGGIIG